VKQGKHSKPRKRGAVNVNQFPSLESITRPTVPTLDAAYYLNREPQTLRAWSCFQSGPIRPINVFGKLAWSVEEIRDLLGGDHA
jgi:hypothetical protein